MQRNKLHELIHETRNIREESKTYTALIPSLSLRPSSVLISILVVLLRQSRYIPGLANISITVETNILWRYLELHVYDDLNDMCVNFCSFECNKA